MVIIAFKKEEEKKRAMNFLREGFIMYGMLFFFFFSEHVWHAIYALLLIPYNDVVEDKALLHNAMNFLSTAIGWLKGNKSFSNDRWMD